MNSSDKKLLSGNSPPRIAIPDGKGGYTYEELETFDLRKPRTPGILPIEVGTRRGIVPAPDRDRLVQPAPGEKAATELAPQLGKALPAKKSPHPADRPGWPAKGSKR